MKRQYQKGSNSARKRRTPYKGPLNRTMIIRNPQVARANAGNQVFGLKNMKYVEFQYGNTVSNAGLVVDLLQGQITPGGSPKAQFLGQGIQIKSIQVRGSVLAWDDIQLFRLLVVQYIPTQDPITINYILETIEPMAFIDFSHRDDIICLRDHFWQMTAPGKTVGLYGGVGEKSSFVDYIKGNKCVRCQYDVDLSAWTNGKLYLIAISDSAVGTSHPQFTVKVRINYQDLPY